MSTESSKTIECPSGLAGIIRGLKVREERILTDRRLAKLGTQLDDLLGACWLETIDPGPYTCCANGKVPWDQVLQGDRFYVLLQMRALTYGDEYDFSVTCGNPHCVRRIDWSVGLDALPLRRLSNANRAALTDGNRIEAVLPTSGKRLLFKLLTGADERRLTAMREAKGAGGLSDILALRVASVEGVDAQHRQAFLDDLSLRDANHLVGEFERADCGVETTIDIECPHCFHVQGVDLPLDPGFLWPKTKAATPCRPCA